MTLFLFCSIITNHIINYKKDAVSLNLLYCGCNGVKRVPSIHLMACYTLIESNFKQKKEILRENNGNWNIGSHTCGLI